MGYRGWPGLALTLSSPMASSTTRSFAASRGAGVYSHRFFSSEIAKFERGCCTVTGRPLMVGIVTHIPFPSPPSDRPRSGRPRPEAVTRVAIASPHVTRHSDMSRRPACFTPNDARQIAVCAEGRRRVDHFVDAVSRKSGVRFQPVHFLGEHRVFRIRVGSDRPAASRALVGLVRPIKRALGLSRVPAGNRSRPG
jgi:hypothetical protein